MADSGDLLRAARIAAGLNQREMARRAGTAQSVVARIEGGQVSPSWDTLQRLLSVAGFAVEARLSVSASAVERLMDDVDRILHLTPAERLHELRNADRFFAAAGRA